MLVQCFLNWRLMRRYRKPKRFDRNLVVIGAGSAGLVSAYIAAAVKARVTLIEKHRMGGDCLNTGCVPSKALISSARFLAQQRRAQEYGFRSASAEFDFADVMQRVQSVIERIEPHDSVERYTRLGVECLQGEARVLSPYQVQVGDQILTTRNIIIATGASPLVPDLPGLAQVKYFTSDTIWQLRELPRRLLVLGGGPIGCELAQCFARFGSRVSLVDGGERILAREDSDISDMIMSRLVEEGIDLHMQHRALRLDIVNGEQHLVCRNSSGEVAIAFDTLLIAVGRKANVHGFGLEDLPTPVAVDKTVRVNAFMQTNYPNIYACGDVAGPFQFTHTASHQAWYATVNALFRGLKRFKVDYSVIPWATFTDPEVARVGLNEQEAREQGIAYELTTYGIDDLDRAIADGEAYGLIKVLTKPGKDKILGVTIIGHHGAELLSEFVLAMRHGIGLNKILATIHIYPTWSEANKYVAGNWRKAHTPEAAMKLLKVFHRWRRR